jgi:hypothetical protein
LAPSRLGSHFVAAICGRSIGTAHEQIDNLLRNVDFTTITTEALSAAQVTPSR